MINQKKIDTDLIVIENIKNNNIYKLNLSLNEPTSIFYFKCKNLDEIKSSKINGILNS